MDDLDAAILHAINVPDNRQWDVRLSLSAVARSVGVSDDQVRTRFKRMQDLGFITGWELWINPSLFQMETVRLELPIADLPTKDAVLERFQDIEGARMAFDLYGRGLALIFYHAPDSQGRLRRLLESIAGCEGWMAPVPIEASTLVPDAQDWRLLRALRRDPRTSREQLGEEAGMSTRNVQRRLDRLVAHRAAFLSLQTDFTRLPGVLAIEGRLTWSGSDGQEEARRVIQACGRLAFTNLRGPTWSFGSMVERIIEVERLQARLQGIRGVDSVHVDLVQRRLCFGSWMDEELVRRSTTT